jgi:hypothetical protein
MNVISELSHPKITEEWENLTTKRGRRTFELRLRNPWIDEWTGEAKQKWILASCDQEFDEEGNLKTIMGCMFVPLVVCQGHLMTRIEQILVHRSMQKKTPLLEQTWLRSLHCEHKKLQGTREISSRWQSLLHVVWLNIKIYCVSK